MEDKNEEVVKFNYKDPNGYRIRVGGKYIVYRIELGGNFIYKTPIQKTDIDGEKITVYKVIAFNNKDKPPVPNGTWIMPLRLFEDCYFKKGDEKHYNPQWRVVITDWEIVKDAEQIEKESKVNAIKMYQDSIYDNIPF